MGPPEKKQKRLSPIDIKLEVLRKNIAYLLPLWEDYAPARFMETMRHMQKQIDEVAPDEIEHFITTKTNHLLHTLDILDDELLKATHSQLLETAALYQPIRKDMREYVGDVRGCLEGQS
jgi:hypothetical protein